jgi:KipI family sensor histidine kinase inhibitor
MRALRTGRSALLVECDCPADVSAWYVALVERRSAGLLDADEIVPGALTVLVDGVEDPPRVAADIRQMRVVSEAGTDSGHRKTVEVPTVYDGPDLDDVARLWDTDRAGVVAVHSGVEFYVAFCGFAPGFAYLGGLPERYHVPRRSAPRQRVAAGTVALAGEFGGIYPAASPGGWQCLGRTDVRLFDLDANPPGLLTPGTRVRFIPVAVH